MHLSLSAPHRRAFGHGLMIAGVLVALWMYGIVRDPTWQRPGGDSVAYWGINLADPYAGATEGRSARSSTRRPSRRRSRRSTCFHRELFVVLWSVLLAALAWWLARPWPGALLILALPVSEEILIGNIHLLLAAAIVVGFRWPGTWAFVLLTKVTPGIGLLWFPVRRQFRALAIALGTTAAIVAVSFVLAPDLWRWWIGMLRHDGGAGASLLLARLAIAGALTAWGAATGRRWVVPLAAMLALPTIWMQSFSMLPGASLSTGTGMLPCRGSRAPVRGRPQEQPPPRAEQHGRRDDPRDHAQQHPDHILEVDRWAGTVVRPRGRSSAPVRGCRHWSGTSSIRLQDSLPRDEGQLARPHGPSPLVVQLLHRVDHQLDAEPVVDQVVAGAATVSASWWSDSRRAIAAARAGGSCGGTRSPVDAVLDHLGDAAHVGRDDRARERHRLQDREALRLAVGREDGDVEGGGDGGDVVPAAR